MQVLGTSIQDPILGKSVRTSIHVSHFFDLPCGEITIEGSSQFKHCTTHQQQRNAQGYKNGSKKKRGESIVQSFNRSKKELVQKQKKGRREKEAAKIMTRSWRGWGKCVRTVLHCRHFPNLPCGNVCIKTTLVKKDK